MKKLKLMTEEELDSIFGTVARLVPFHEGEILRQPLGLIRGWQKCYVSECLIVKCLSSALYGNLLRQMI